MYRVKTSKESGDCPNPTRSDAIIRYPLSGFEPDGGLKDCEDKNHTSPDGCELEFERVCVPSSGPVGKVLRRGKRTIDPQTMNAVELYYLEINPRHGGRGCQGVFQDELTRL
jgi:hypothetical protein